jgi:hypothetical protein
LDAPAAVASLLETLRRAGAADQVAALLARDRAAHAKLDDPRAVAGLRRALHRAYAVGQAEALTARLPAEGLFDLFCEETNNQEAY